MKDDFEKRNVKVIGLSVDGVDDHNKWLDDIEDVSGTGLTIQLLLMKI